MKRYEGSYIENGIHIFFTYELNHDGEMVNEIIIKELNLNKS